MKLYLTKGIFGEKIEELGNETTLGNDMTSARKAMAEFCQNEKNKEKYKIEPYSRYICDKENIAVDFGDYSYFFLVEGLKDTENFKM